MLKDQFIAMASRHCTSLDLVERFWKEIEEAYTASDRHFHTLQHLQQVFAVLQPQQSLIEDWDTLAFAVFYHDLVYDVVTYVTENDNEDKSADKAAAVLKAIGYPADKIERCRRHILATKLHLPSADSDTNFLTDADLSVLGQPWDHYQEYMKGIRAEYAIFPNNIYHAGRLRVLRQFGALPKLFKTPAFAAQFEAQAKDNIQRELEIIALS